VEQGVEELRAMEEKSSSDR